MVLKTSEQRLAFLGFSARDTELLQALRPVVEPHLDELARALCEVLQQFPDTAQLLRDRTTTERTRAFLRDYLRRITAGNFDGTYFADRTRIGQMHERVGLAPRWALLSYHHIARLLTPLVRRCYAGDPPRADDTLLALNKIFLLDASLAIDAYIASDRYRHLRQLESIVNDSADVIFLLDTEHRFRTWNRAAERVFGWRADEILGKPFSVIVPPELLQAGELERIEQQVNRFGHYHFESIRQARDGRRIPVEITVSLLRDPQGTPLGRSAILRDIAERKHLEEEKLRAERLAVIGTMSAKLAHEIRNPLSSITLNIELVRDEIETLAQPHPGGAAREAHNLIAALDSEVRRIQRVTEDYLQFARMPKPQREPISLNQLLGDGLAFMQSLFSASRVTLQTQFDASLPPLHADENQLWQAVLNVIRNAIESMPAGGMLTVTTTKNDTHAVLTVTDTGKGMTAEEQQQLFKPFFSTKSGGTGLGLPLTQQIVTEHGGTIAFNSAPNRGTTFTIELPLTQETAHGPQS